jgi:intein-encoded DNA endonuclease-like protein
MQIKILYKSGNITETDIDLTPEEIAERIRNNSIDINPKTLSMIRWSEVEAIIPK